MNAEVNTPAEKRAKPEVVTVTMTDGRTVDFAGKRKVLKDTIIEGTTVKVRFDFRNGETRSFTIPDSLLLLAADHGMEQKGGDELAGIDDIEDQVMALDELLERLAQGDWNAKREGGNGMSGTSTLLRALVELTGQTREQVAAGLKTLKQAEKLQLRNSPQLKPIVERIEAEKAAGAAAVDVGALLGRFGVVQ